MTQMPQYSEPSFGDTTNESNDTLRVDGEADKAGAEGSSTTSTSSTAPVVEYLRMAECTNGSPLESEGACSTTAGDSVTCADGMDPLLPLWSRTLQADGTWGAWTMETGLGCPSQSDLLELIRHEWTQLHITAPPVSIQPGTGTVVATLPTVAFADAAPLTHGATLLGADVTIRATPTTYLWDWGDGDTTTTTDPGAPYPDDTVSHAYTRAADAATITLHTTWTGHYRIGAGAWTAFETTLTTDSTPIPLTVTHPRTRLVDGPLAG
ncbi:hypothetical protein [Demequina gelatinilytica]|uniref:hypothetical protein n=1 Tax=Demequina gelatinilytica TaxID=1638980 RepID=UPI0012E0A078|nr:hypothetical protein [Demequina gelatinilytica]